MIRRIQELVNELVEFNIHLQKQVDLSRPNIHAVLELIQENDLQIVYFDDLLEKIIAKTDGVATRKRSLTYWDIKFLTLKNNKYSDFL